MKQTWHWKESRKNLLTLAETLPQIARLDLLMIMTVSDGRQLSWVLKTHPTQVASSSWTLLSLLTTPSSPLRCSFRQKSITQTSMPTAPFAWTSLRTSGRPPWPSPRCCSQSAHCSRTPTPTTLLCQKSPISTRTTANSTLKLPASGQTATPHEWMVWHHINVNQNRFASKTSTLKCSIITHFFFFCLTKTSHSR